jgi:hypothetical protein
MNLAVEVDTICSVDSAGAGTVCGSGLDEVARMVGKELK